MMHDLAARLTGEIAAARAAIWSSYSRLWGEHERPAPGVDTAGYHLREDGAGVERDTVQDASRADR